MEKNQYDSISQINQLTWVVERDGELDREEYNYRMRMYYPHEMDILLSENGFTIMKKFGNYQRDPMNSDSDMQIYVSEPN